MPVAVVIRHVLHEDAGSLATVLAERGITLRYVDMGTESLASIKPDDLDLLVILGGPISVNDGDLFPFIQDELSLIQQCLQKQLPILGFCLGGQMIAKAMGATIKKGTCFELGWSPLTFQPHPNAPYLDALAADGGQMLHWHYETFELPEGAVLLASSDKCAHQIFTYDKVLAMQCHPEVLSSTLENWFIGNVDSIKEAGRDLNQFREQTQQLAPMLEKRAKAFFHGLMDHVGLV